MPKPIYIICSESGAQDVTTGLASHFNVVEQILLNKLPAPTPGAPPVVVGLNLQFSALWMRVGEDDPDAEYEFETNIFLPPDGKEFSAGKGILKFQGPRCRTVAIIQKLALRGAGVLRAEARLRLAGSDDNPWAVQSYEIPVVHDEQNDPSATSTA